MSSPNTRKNRSEKNPSIWTLLSSVNFVNQEMSVRSYFRKIEMDTKHEFNIATNRSRKFNHI